MVNIGVQRYITANDMMLQEILASLLVHHSLFNLRYLRILHDIYDWIYDKLHIRYQPNFVDLLVKAKFSQQEVPTA